MLRFLLALLLVAAGGSVFACDPPQMQVPAGYRLVKETPAFQVPLGYRLVRDSMYPVPQQQAPPAVRRYVIEEAPPPVVVTERRTVTYAAPRMVTYAAPAYAAPMSRLPFFLRRAPAMGYDAATVAAIRAERRQRIGGAALKIGLTAAALAFFR